MTSKSKVTLTFAGEDKQLQKTFDNVEKRSDRLRNNFKQFSKIAGTAGLALGGLAVAGGTALFKLGESFDKAYDKIIVGTGATGDALEGLQDSFKTVLATGPDSFDSVATAIADLNTATGLAGKPLENLSRQFLDLSRITETDLGGNIKSVTRLFGDWGVAVDEQSDTLDKLFVVSQNTGIGIDELADKAVKSGAPFRQLGFTLEEQISLLGKWHKEGVNVDLVLGGLRQAISKFAREGKDVPSAIRGTIDAIKEAGSASEATTLAIEAFGSEAGPDLAALVREGRLEVEDLVAILEDAPGAIGEAADATASFGEKWDEFKNKLAVALEPAATAVFDKLGEFFDWLGPKIEDDVIPAVDDFWTSMEEGESVGGIWGDLGETVGETFDTIVREGRVLKGFIDDELLPTLKKMFDKMDESFTQTEEDSEKFFDDMGALWKFFFAETESDTDEHTAAQESKFDTMFGNLLDSQTNLNSLWFGLWDTITTSISDAISELAEDIKWVSERISEDWDNAMGNMTVAWETFTGMFSGVAGAIGSALSGVVDAIEGPFREGYRKAVEWANKIPGINIATPTVGGGRSFTPRSTGGRNFTPTPVRRTYTSRNVRHSGGVVPGPMGRETPILAKSGEHVVTANQMAAINNARGSGTEPVVIRIDSRGSRMDDVLVEVLRKSIKNRGGSVQAVLG